MTAASEPFDFGIRDELLRDPENAALYLAEYLDEGNMELFQEALRKVAKAQQGGIAAVARSADVNRENLYRALSKSGKPQLDTVVKTLNALGMRFTISVSPQ